MYGQDFLFFSCFFLYSNPVIKDNVILLHFGEWAQVVRTCVQIPVPVYMYMYVYSCTPVKMVFKDVYMELNICLYCSKQT